MTTKCKATQKPCLLFPVSKRLIVAVLKIFRARRLMNRPRLVVFLNEGKLDNKGPVEEARLITSQEPDNEIYFRLQEEKSFWLDKYEEALDLLRRTREIAVTGRKVKAAARRGGEAKEGSADDRHEEWQKEADRIAKERSKKLRPLTKIELARLIARKTGEKVDTIRRVIKKPA